MSDVFVSYAREDLEVAHELADSLRSHGWSVWWDRALLGGQEYRSAIRRELDLASAVVVIWSADSFDSSFVLDEAQVAKGRGVLIPIRLDGSEIPLGFGQVHTVDMISRKVTDGHEEVARAVGRLLPTELGGEGPADRIRVAPVPPHSVGRPLLGSTAASLIIAPVIALGFALVVKTGNELVNSLGYLLLALAAFIAVGLTGDQDPWRRATAAVLMSGVVVMLLWGIHLIGFGGPRGSEFENVVTLLGVWLMTITVLPCNVRHRNELHFVVLIALLLGGLMIRVFFRVHIDSAGIVMAGLTPIVLVLAAWSVGAQARFDPGAASK